MIEGGDTYLRAKDSGFHIDVLEILPANGCRREPAQKAARHADEPIVRGCYQMATVEESETPPLYCGAFNLFPRNQNGFEVPHGLWRRPCLFH